MPLIVVWDGNIVIVIVFALPLGPLSTQNPVATATICVRCSCTCTATGDVVPSSAYSYPDRLNFMNSIN